MEWDAQDGARERDPMLASRQSCDTETGDRPSRPGKQLQAGRPARRAGFGMLMSLCVASLVLLAGFLSFQFTQQQTATHNPEGQGAEVATTTAAAITPSIPAFTSGPPTASPTAQAPKWGIAPAEQFDLNTGFVVQDKPMLRKYVFNITRETGAPDGLVKSMILVNGQSPGPLIEANTGDTIRVVVHNSMHSESTTIHWHGIDQKNSPWMDGVHGVTQCGIPPGASFTYEFNLTDQRGSFWYHSHLSVQYTDGLYGPLIIHDPAERVPAVDDDKIIMIGELYHQPAEQLLTEYLGNSPSWSPKSPGMEPPASNFIINGRHILNCSLITNPSDSCTGGSRFSTRVKSGHRIRMRLISHSTSVPFWFTIDNHLLEIIEVEGVEIEPIVTTRVYLNPGQRYSVLVNATQSAGNYLIRTTAAKTCFHLPHSKEVTAKLAAIDYQSTGTLSYDDTAIENKPLGEPWNVRAFGNPGVGEEPWKTVCQDLPFDLAKPLRGREAYSVGPRNFHYFKYKMASESGVSRTFINDTLYTPLKDDAALWHISLQNVTSQDAALGLAESNLILGQHVLVSQDSAMAAQIVINSQHMMAHPWHLHGQNFQVVGWGQGAFGNGETQWNLENPLRRDTVTVPGSAHVVIRFLADNPGIWALHCHILWHAEGGMLVSTAQRIDELRTMLGTLDAPNDKDNNILRKYCSAGLT